MLVIFAATKDEFLYYFKHYDQREIWRVSLDGSREEPVLQEIDGLGIDNWDVVSNGLYYYHRSNDSKVLSFYDFETRESREIRAMPGIESITIGPDEQYLFYAKMETSWKDLILVENVNLD